jgi:hypothetical protein
MLAGSRPLRDTNYGAFWRVAAIAVTRFVLALSEAEGRR